MDLIECIRWDLGTLERALHYINLLAGLCISQPIARLLICKRIEYKNSKKLFFVVGHIEQHFAGEFNESIK